ncbi:MAG: permease, partial [Cyanobacteria bacterium J06649_4]
MYSKNVLNKTSIQVGALLSLWAIALVIATQSGLLSTLYLPVISLIIGATIALPTLWYRKSPLLQAWMNYIGRRRIVAFHIWRIPAALLFFHFGLRGELPSAFWVLAGVGDLAAGIHAVFVTLQKSPTVEDYKRFHFFGFADFVVAVGTGMTYTLLQDPRMSLIAVLPFAFVPLF